MGLFEVNEAAEIVRETAHPDANIIFGAVIDDVMGDEVRITVIAAGFDRFEGERTAAVTPEKREPASFLREREPATRVGRRPEGGRTSGLGFDTDDDLDRDEGGTGGGDDDFDVPEFLR
jgi:cell division protein FtsZ